MSNSLADQLLKAGLVSEDDVQKARAPKPKRKRPPHKAKKAASKQPQKSPAKAANDSAKKIIEPSKAEQKKQEQQAEAEKRRALNLKLNTVFDNPEVAEPNGEQKFNYPYQNKVRGIYVSAEQHKQLTDGVLAVTLFKAKTKLIPVALIDDILRIDPKRFIYRADESNNSQDEGDHPVPDDLMW